MKALRCSQTLSRLVAETLPAANHSRDRFSRLVAAIGDESNLPIAEAERSHNDIAKLLRRALRVKLAAATADGEPPWSDCIDFYPSTFVYMVRGVYYEASYAIDEAGTVTIGEPAEVVPVVSYQRVGNRSPGVTVEPAPAVEASDTEILGDCIPLTEAGLGGLQEAKALIRIATPGWGTSGYYSAEVLKRDGSKVFPSGTQMYWNHPTEAETNERPEGDLDKLAAVTIAPAKWMDNGPDGAGLYTEAKIREKYSADVAELKNDIGVSLRALGRFSTGKAEGKEGVIIEQLIRGKSIDFVTQAGRGGKVLELFESAGRRKPATTAADGRNQEGDSMAMSETEVKQLQEATAAATSANALVSRLQNDLLLMRAENFVTSVCEAQSLPLVVRKRVVDTMKANPIVKDGAIDEGPFSEAIKRCIAAELAYLREAGISGVSGFGASQREDDSKTLPTLEEARADLDKTLKSFVS